MKKIFTIDIALGKSANATATGATASYSTTN